MVLKKSRTQLRIKVFSHIQGLPISFFTKNTVGRLSTRVTNDIQNMQEMFTTVITFVMKDLSPSPALSSLWWSWM